MIEHFTSISEAGERVYAMLATELQGWLTTVDPDGAPQPTTVWFAPDGDSLIIYSVPDKPKLHNIAVNPRVSFHLNSDRIGERWVVMTGDAAVDDSLPPFDEVPAYLDKYAAALDHWGMDIATTAEEYSVPVRVIPSRVRLRTR